MGDRGVHGDCENVVWSLARNVANSGSNEVHCAPDHRTGWGLGIWDGWDEGYLAGGAIGSALAVATPALCWVFTLQRERQVGAASTSRIGASVVALIGIVVYWNYAITVPSDPDTTGHLHIVLFPILYATASVILAIPLLLIDLFRTKKQKE